MIVNKEQQTCRLSRHTLWHASQTALSRGFLIGALDVINGTVTVPSSSSMMETPSLLRGETIASLLTLSTV